MADQDDASSDETPEARRARRANWPGGVVRLGQEPLVDDVRGTTVDERVRWVSLLSWRAFALSSAERSSYTRSTMPGRLVRRAP